MLRTVADDTPSPGALTSSEDATGSPDAMYSRTSAASTRLDRSCDSAVISTQSPRLLINYTTSARAASSRAAARAWRTTSARSTRTGVKSSTSTSPSTIVVRTSLPRAA